MMQDTTAMTTFRLSKDMLLQAKKVAKDSKITLAELVEIGLNKFLEGQKKHVYVNDGVKKVYTSVKLSKKLIRKARTFAIVNDISFGALVRTSLGDYIKKGGGIV